MVAKGHLLDCMLGTLWMWCLCSGWLFLTLLSPTSSLESIHHPLLGTNSLLWHVDWANWAIPGTAS